MTQKVLITGALGRVGTAIIDHLGNNSNYQFTYLDRNQSPEFDSVVADITNYDKLLTALRDHDAVIHLAAYPETDGSWDEILNNNIIGTYNVLKAAREAAVPKFIFSSTIHVVGMYEVEFAPQIYEKDFDVTVDKNTPRRPDSFYGASKSFNEDLGRYFVENYEYPKRFYSLRICTLRENKYDHPYGDAERGVQEGKWSRKSNEYNRQVKRMKSMWLSRQDFAHLVECCLQDEEVVYDVFYGVSANDRRWCDIGHAKKVINYNPSSNGEEWDSPSPSKIT